MNTALLLTALFNGAWQGALLCTLALLAFRLFRRLNAATMFAVWSVLLGIAMLLPLANYAFAPKPYVVRVVQTAPHHTMRVQPDTSAVRARSIGPEPMEGAVRISTPNFAAAGDAIMRYSPAILSVLALIALLRLALLARDVIRMLLARARVRPIDAPVAFPDAIARPFRYAASDEFHSPCVLGFAPALIVIPEDLLADDRGELASVVLHEREHVRRFDDVQNVLHRLIGAVAFFCPGVRIALRELALYREQICDDAAVNATGDRVSYAMTLTDLAQWAQGRGAPVPSLIFKRRHLIHRLEVLLDSAVSHSLRMNRRFAFAAASAVVVAAALVLRIQVPVIAQTIVTPALPHVSQATRTHIEARIAKVRVEAKQVRAQTKQTHAQIERIDKQIVKVRTDLGKARAAAKPLHIHVQPRPVRPAHVAAVVAAALPAPTPMPLPIAATTVAATQPGDLLDALAAAGLRNLPVDQLIAMRDHGVNPELVRAASSYFGHVGAQDLVYLADHGVGPTYLATLTAGGLRGISPHDAVALMDHGVTSQLLGAATSYFSHPSAADLTYLADHGVTAQCLQGYRDAGLTGASVRDVVRLFDNGVNGRYVAYVRRMNPHASVDDIIRLHSSGV